MIALSVKGRDLVVPNQICYWQPPLPEWDLPIRIVERTNQKIDITISDWSMHWHEELEFQYILSGGIRLNCGNQAGWMYAHDLFFANWCEPHHALEFEDGTHYYVIQVDLDWLLKEHKNMRLSRYRDALTIYAQNFDSFIHQDSRLCQMMDEIIREYHQQEFGYEIAVKGLLLQVISVIFQKYFHIPENMETLTTYDNSLRYTRHVLNYISHNYNRAISLETLAKETGLTKSYLCQIFKKHTGCTITRYINRLRCYRAISLIETGMSVTEAAFEVGYSDYNYFSRIFKKIIGISPTDSMKKISEDLKQ